MTTNVSPIDLAQSAKSLATAISGDVLIDAHTRTLYSTDASLYQVRPQAVALPKSHDDVVCCLQWASEHGVSIIPRGSGTSLSGQSIGAGLVIDFSPYMNRVLQIDVERRTAQIQPGVVLDHLNAAVARHGLQFGPDVATSSRANLGGMIGNNSAGARSVLYGKTVDHVIALKTVLADGSSATFGPTNHRDLLLRQQAVGLEGHIYRGFPQIVTACRDEILRRYPRIVRRVSGYNLDEFVDEFRQSVDWPPMLKELWKHEHLQFPDARFNLAKLLVGAEGTLACVTEAVVHLVPAPPARAVLVLEFDSLTHAIAAVDDMLAAEPSAIELLDGLIVRMAKQSLEYRHYLDFVVGEPETLLLVEFSGATGEDVAARLNTVSQSLTGRPGLTRILPAIEPSLRDHVWACRKASLPLLMAIPGARKPIAFVEDTAVAPQRLPEFVARFRELLRRHHVEGAFYGHASVGCLHIRPMLDAKNQDDLQKLREISREVCELVIEFEGAMSGEHGDGLARSYLNPDLFGPKIYAAFEQVKTLFDPQWRLNPGKVVRGPEPTQNLRQYSPPSALPIVTTFDFSADGGLARAAEMCNGNGVCRKTQSGTMCPSYMATLDEEHSTRGRANALRLALSGETPSQDLTDPRMFETFDLCLQCKGCKAECPSNVDVAKMKAEFLDQYYRRHGAPLGARLMANVHRLNRWGSATAPLSNWLSAAPGVSWVAERLLGVDRRRPLPTFTRDHFAKWNARRAPSSDNGLGEIVLLADCLTSYCEPRVNQAAMLVLESAGYRVHVVELPCCGRAAISKGQLALAKQLATATVQQLSPWVARGVPVVGCEPSCVLTIADDYPDLLCNDEARCVASGVTPIDTYLARVDAPALRPAPDGLDPRHLVLHGHCFQKALLGVRDTISLLGRYCQSPPQVVDSGCCGMAGSFGYEHYDVSMKIAERVLLPAIRSQPDSVVVAPGFSCRGQIAHGAGRIAMHPIEYIASRLQGGTLSIGGRPSAPTV